MVRISQTIETRGNLVQMTVFHAVLQTFLSQNVLSVRSDRDMFFGFMDLCSCT